MKKIITIILFLTALKASGQKSLSITASPDGDGFTADTRTVTPDANKFKLNSGATLKSFKIQCNNLAANHKLVISVSGANMAAGALNYIDDHAVHTFLFDQDLAEKTITTTETAPGMAPAEYIKFTFTKGAAAPAAAPAPGAAAVTPTTVTIKYIDNNGNDSKPSTYPTPLPMTLDVDPAVTSLNGFKISAANLAAGHKLVITQTGTTQQDTYSPGDGEKTENWTGLINGKIVVLEDKNDGSPKIPVASVLFNQPANTTGKNPATSSLTSPQSAINIKYYRHTTYGYIDPKDPNTVHLFFDMFGNNLFETIPPGIPNHKYEVHIVYPAYSDQPDDIVYSVKQTGGTPNNGTLLFQNTGILSSLSGTFQSKTLNQSGSAKNYDIWKVADFYLGNAQDDIPFTITSSVIGDDGKKTTGDVASYTIKMSSIYHGSFDVGLINSSLRNPTFTLTNAPDGSANQVIKTTDDGKRGMVSVMATFYTSPIILLEKYIFHVKDIPDFKLAGRDFLDDHKIYERLYPTIGVSINERAFDNLFYGFNWEISRGLSIFGGRHWGKINTFTMNGYTPGQVITQAQFNYYTNTKWATAWAYGIKLDVLVITNLIGSGNKN